MLVSSFPSSSGQKCQLILTRTALMCYLEVPLSLFEGLPSCLIPFLALDNSLFTTFEGLDIKGLLKSLFKRLHVHWGGMGMSVSSKVFFLQENVTSFTPQVWVPRSTCWTSRGQDGTVYHSIYAQQHRHSGRELIRWTGPLQSRHRPAISGVAMQLEAGLLRVKDTKVNTG